MALEPSEEEKIRSLIKLFLHWNNGVVFALHKSGATRFKLGGWDFSKRLSLNCILYHHAVISAVTPMGEGFNPPRSLTEPPLPLDRMLWKGINPNERWFGAV